ncbi:hypothetical protein EON63_03255 [archaeon]|nr:MAG: hypothetical protein EON63_03255 [archaeon]
MQGYPTLKFFPAGSAEPEDYQGERTAQAITDFINSKAGKLDLGLRIIIHIHKNLQIDTCDVCVCTCMHTRTLIHHVSVHITILKSILISVPIALMHTLTHIHTHTGTQRNVDGSLAPTAGRLDALDSIIANANFAITEGVVAQLKEAAQGLEGIAYGYDGMAMMMGIDLNYLMYGIW